MAALKLRQSGGHIADEEVWFLPDSGKEGLKSTLLSSFGAAQKDVRHLNIHYDEDSLEERLDKLRGFMPVNQHERMYVITKGPLKMEKRRRLHFAGTNRGNSLGPVAMPKFDAQGVWRLPPKQKKDVIGKHGAKILVGGPLPGVPAEELKRVTEMMKGSTAAEPVFWHALPPAVDEELQHSYNLKCMYALTVGDGSMAMTCLRLRRPLFGVCLTIAHKTALLSKLEADVWKAMQTEKDKLFEPGLFELVKSATGPAAEDADEGKEVEKRNKNKKAAKSTKKDDEAAADDAEPAKKKPKKDQSKAELMAKIASLTGSKGGAIAVDVDEEEADSAGE